MLERLSNCPNQINKPALQPEKFRSVLQLLLRCKRVLLPAPVALRHATCPKQLNNSKTAQKHKKKKKIQGMWEVTHSQERGTALWQVSKNNDTQFTKLEIEASRCELVAQAEHTFNICSLLQNLLLDRWPRALKLLRWESGKPGLMGLGGHRVPLTHSVLLCSGDQMFPH